MSISSHYNELKNLSVSGVNNYTAPPERVNSADLPLKYVRVAQNEQTLGTFSNTYGLNTINYEIIILIETIGLSDNLTNQDLLIEIMDNLVTSMETLTNVTAYSTNVTVLRMRDNDFWSMLVGVTIID